MAACPTTWPRGAIGIGGPSVFRVARAVADIPLGRNSSDSQEQLREALAHGPLRTGCIGVSLQPADVRRLVEAGRRVFHRSQELALPLDDVTVVA